MKYNFEQTRSDYLTPPELYDTALKEFGIHKFDCDVCCTLENIPAYHYFKDGMTDGLSAEWYPINWCNPPYKDCGKWIHKAFIEQNKGRQTAMLVPVRTETKYWHDYILFNPKVKINWLRKGYKFINPETREYMNVYKNALALIFFKKQPINMNIAEWSDILNQLESEVRGFTDNGFCYYDPSDMEDCTFCDKIENCNYDRKYRILNIIKQGKSRLNCLPHSGSKINE